MNFRIFYQVGLNKFLKIFLNKDVSDRSKSEPFNTFKNPDSTTITPEFIEKTYSDEEIIKKANEYFEKIQNPDYLIAKPFYEISGAPTIIGNLAASLHALDLCPGIKVLDFGCGSGWLTRILSQLKCDTTGVDISSAALEIADKMMRALPLIGADSSKLNFKLFDGKTLNIPTGSMERIICFDSFHHLKDQEIILLEFFRILKPGGFVILSEPGPNHSHTDNAIFEMKNFHVLEKDINVDSIDLMAKKSQFYKTEVAVFCPIPNFYDLNNFNEIIASNQKLAGRHVADYLENHRLIKLSKEGDITPDSRFLKYLNGKIEANSNGDLVELTIYNTGSCEWLPSKYDIGGVCLTLHELDDSEQILKFNSIQLPFIEKSIKPGENVNFKLRLSQLDVANKILKCDLIAKEITLFSHVGMKCPVIRV
jgi:2-polyprenyl-3-methyl-5-hydroxy-6-metoxy-1,4-benzoquinol methylase